MRAGFVGTLGTGGGCGFTETRGRWGGWKCKAHHELRQVWTDRGPSLAIGTFTSSRLWRFVIASDGHAVQHLKTLSGREVSEGLCVFLATGGRCFQTSSRPPPQKDIQKIRVRVHRMILALKKKNCPLRSRSGFNEGYRVERDRFDGGRSAQSNVDKPPAPPSSNFCRGK